MMWLEEEMRTITRPRYWTLSTQTESSIRHAKGPAHTNFSVTYIVYKVSKKALMTICTVNVYKYKSSRVIFGPVLSSFSLLLLNIIFWKLETKTVVLWSIFKQKNLQFLAQFIIYSLVNWCHSFIRLQFHENSTFSFDQKMEGKGATFFCLCIRAENWRWKFFSFVLNRGTIDQQIFKKKKKKVVGVSFNSLKILTNEMVEWDWNFQNRNKIKAKFLNSFFICDISWELRENL